MNLTRQIRQLERVWALPDADAECVKSIWGKAKGEGREHLQRIGGIVEQDETPGPPLPGFTAPSMVRRCCRNCTRGKKGGAGLNLGSGSGTMQSEEEPGRSSDLPHTLSVR